MINAHNQMPDEILISLGFVWEKDSYGNLAWRHNKSNRFIYFVLTPQMVLETLINIGQRIGLAKVEVSIDDMRLEID